MEPIKNREDLPAGLVSEFSKYERTHHVVEGCRNIGNVPIPIVTPSGVVAADPGDFILIDSEGNLYPSVVAVHRSTYRNYVEEPGSPVGKGLPEVVETIETTREMLSGLNKQSPCDEHEHAISFLGDALGCLNERTKRREAEGTEGTSAEMTEPTSDTPEPAEHPSGDPPTEPVG